MVVRSDERVEFLSDVLVTAVEHNGYGWFTVEEYPDTDELRDVYAVVRDEYEGVAHRLDLDLVAKGLGVIQRAVYGVDETFPDDGPVLTNPQTGERLYMSPGNRSRLMTASRENDAGEIDVVDALAIVECGVFGKVEYA